LYISMTKKKAIRVEEKLIMYAANKVVYYKGKS
jgi:hypothetical protein